MTETPTLHAAEESLEAVRTGRHAAYPAYKPSGIEWLGDVPEHWEVKPLKYVASINDEALTETTDPAFEFDYVDIGNVDSTYGIVGKERMVFEEAPSRARRVVQRGDTIVSTVRTYLRAVAPVREAAGDLIVSTGFAVVRPYGVDPAFLSFALRESYFIETVVSKSTGVSYPAINASEVGRIFLQVPPLEEQRAIVRFLDEQTRKIDDLIQAKRSLLDLLKEKRQAVITHAVTRGLDPAAKLKPSGVEWLGDVPEHWKYMPIKWIVETPMTDGPHETPEWVDEGIPFVSAEGVFDGRVHLDRARGKITPELHREYSKKACPRRDDVFIVKSGATTGKVGYVDFEDEFNIWSPLALVRCDKKVALSRYAFYTFVEVSFQRQIELFWSYGTQPNIGMRNLEDLDIAIPPLREQKEIVYYLDEETQKIDDLESVVREAIVTLETLRAGIISAAVTTGKIDVRGEVS